MTTNRKALEKEMEKLAIHPEQNFAKILSFLKRHFDEWCLGNLSKAGYPNMKVGYMAFLMNIGPGGITNTELAKKIRVTKQAMSKTSKELQNLDLIELTPNPEDARSSLITLTTHGMKMVIHARHRLTGLTDQYIKAIGQKKYMETLETLNKIIQIHAAMEDEGAC